MICLGVDPSNTRHAWALLSTGNHGDHPEDLSLVCSGRDLTIAGNLEFILEGVDLVAVEMIASYGMAVGAHTFDTCVEIGRLLERIKLLGREAHRVTRIEVKRIVCRSVKANDSSVRAALIDRFGGPSAIKKGGQLHGVAKDTWAALAVAVAAASGEAKWYVPIADKELME